MKKETIKKLIFPPFPFPVGGIGRMILKMEMLKEKHGEANFNKAKKLAMVTMYSLYKWLEEDEDVMLWHYSKHFPEDQD